MSRVAADPRARAPAPPQGIWLLLRLKRWSLRNHLLQIVRETRIKLVSAIVAILLIWVGLTQFFNMLFDYVRDQTFQGIVAIPLIIDFFFVALMIMLIFSNGIICYASLFAREEPAYLLTKPLRPATLTLLKFLESLLLSSWSLVLIGLPLMIALAALNPEIPWSYFVLFLLFFLCFIPIPGAIGLMLAGAVGLWFSRIARRFVLLAVLMVAAGALYILWDVMRQGHGDSREWLHAFFERAELLRGAFWPSSWVSHGLGLARRGEPAGALFYLLITFSNALFWSWLAVKLVGRGLVPAYDRVQACGYGGDYHGGITRWMAEGLFWYLPAELRQIALKDLRTFVRDPAQWSQLLILVALLGLYVLNIPNMPLRLGAFEFQLLISFLNLAAVSLILATFTSRFVFPLLSLEAHQIWLIGMLPVPRQRVLWPKFAFAMTVTCSTGAAIMLLALSETEMSLQLLTINLISVLVVCLGLCGMSVGLGARLPMVHELNAARIANGVGGTINLLSSLVMVAAFLLIYLLLGLHFKAAGMVEMSARAWWLLSAAVALGGLSCAIPLWVGGRHFARLEI